jgi:O-antigen/teichoic acid export membrane protein
MDEIQITKNDAIWSYVAQFFNIASGFITLPLILHMLSTEEIAMNYLMLTIGSMVALLDFGFAPQFGRVITYVFSGAQTLLKEDVVIEKDKPINYKLLKVILHVAKKVYRKISLLVIVLMSTLGTIYIYRVTNGFTNIHNSLVVWVLYTLSTYFNIYYKYYNSFLIGRGYIAESQKATLVSRITYIALTYALLLFGFGLISVTIANLVSPFVSRYMSYRYFFDDELKKKISEQNYTSEEVKETFSVVWYNAKKLGINYVGSYAILKFSLFIAGLFLSLSEVASLGLMMQITSIIVAVSATFYTTFNSKLSFYRVKGDNQGFKKIFGFSLVIHLIVFLSCSLLLIFVGPFLLELIGSKAVLPSTLVLSIYLLVNLLEGNHSLCASAIATSNKVPFVMPSIVTGLLICLFDYVVLQFTSLGLLGLVLVQGICQLAYNNWKWPKWICQDLNTNFYELLRIGMSEIKVKCVIYGKRFI